MSDIIIPPKNFYYGEKFKTVGDYYTITYALDTALEIFLANLLFDNDLSRIIYSSDAYCFKERSRKHGSTLDIPFLNYYRTSVDGNTDRKFFNNAANIQGYYNLNNYAEAIGAKIKMAPIHINYESTLFFHQDKDLEYAMSQLLFQSSNETRIYSTVTAPNDSTISNVGFLKFNFDYKPDYQEQDWLEENKITSIKLDFEIDTVMIYTNPSVLGLTKEITFNFLVAKGLLNKTDPLDSEVITQKLTEYFTIADTTIYDAEAEMNLQQKVQSIS